MNSAGYGVFWDGKRLVRAHRYAYETKVGPIPDGLDLCHSCDNPTCVNPGHLWPGTATENIQDMVRKGRSNRRRGESHPDAKLTAAEAIEVFNADGLQREIGDQFGIHQTHVSQIKRGKAWQHITAQSQPDHAKANN
ncbi:MAG: HNH endonuclease signature motif containing protein [Rhodospirillales bacterium]